MVAFYEYPIFDINLLLTPSFFKNIYPDNYRDKNNAIFFTCFIFFTFEMRYFV